MRLWERAKQTSCYSASWPRNFMKFKLSIVLPLLLLMAPALAAQQGAAIGEPLTVQTTSLPKAFLQTPYLVGLKAKGGILPLKWTIASGSLPPGLVLSDDGMLTG